MGSSKSKVLKTPKTSKGITDRHIQQMIEKRIHSSIDKEPIDLECQTPILAPEEDSETAFISDYTIDTSREECVFMQIVQGRDGRVLVDQPDKWPFSVQGRLVSVVGTGSFLG